MADVVAIGEALIDLVPLAIDAEGQETLLKAAGGAPANVAVGLARLGVASAFIGAIGDDGFGRFLAKTLAGEGVDTSGMVVTTKAPTAIAAVALGAEGQRDFVFYGHPPAHAMLRPEDVDEALIREAKIVHFGTISLIDEPGRSATLRAVDLAHRHGVRVGFDPNLRLALWPDRTSAIEATLLGVSLANVVKLSEEELRFLQPGGCDLVEAARAQWHPALELVAVTRGSRGCLWLDPREDGDEPGFPVAAVDTTGAGDAFTAALLAGIVGIDDLDALNRPAFGRMLRFACAAGALATTRRGAVPALPDRASVERLLSRE